MSEPAHAKTFRKQKETEKTQRASSQVPGGMGEALRLKSDHIVDEVFVGPSTVVLNKNMGR